MTAGGGTPDTSAESRVIGTDGLAALVALVHLAAGSGRGAHRRQPGRGA
ncbi:hypothetical protein [Kitasatospora sp. NPDC051914]